MTVILTNHTRVQILEALAEEILVAVTATVTFVEPGKPVCFHPDEGLDGSVGMGAQDVKTLGIKKGDKIRLIMVPQRSLVHMVEKI